MLFADDCVFYFLLLLLILSYTFLVCSMTLVLNHINLLKHLSSDVTVVIGTAYKFIVETQ